VRPRLLIIYAGTPWDFGASTSQISSAGTVVSCHQFPRNLIPQADICQHI
jgi:hypothetical protein